MVAHVDLAALDAVQQVFLLFLEHLGGVLGAELEGGVGLGHKAGHADGHLHPLALGLVRVLVIEVHDPLGGVGDALDVLHGLGGQTHHEIELHRGVAALKGDAAALFDLLPGDVFVDDVPQPLGAGLGGEGQAALAHPGGLLDQALR